MKQRFELAKYQEELREITKLIKDNIKPGDIIITHNKKYDEYRVYEVIEFDDEWMHFGCYTFSLADDEMSLADDEMLLVKDGGSEELCLTEKDELIITNLRVGDEGIETQELALKRAQELLFMFTYGQE